jgi:hypothetical protein
VEFVEFVKFIEFVELIKTETLGDTIDYQRLTEIRGDWLRYGGESGDWR